MAASKKKTSGKSAKKTPASKNSAAAKKTPAKKTSAPKPAAKKSAPKKAATPKQVPVAPVRKSRAAKAQAVGTRDLLAYGQPVEKSRRLNPWLKQQHLRLLALKDTLLDSMAGVARDNLRSHDAHEVSAHGLHQADAGSDSYDRDFALNLLSQEQDALFEIDEALKRIASGSYGVCEMSNKPIPKARLEARPFARFTVECQSEVERKNRFSRIRQPIARLFDSVDEEGSEDSEDEPSTESKE